MKFLLSIALLLLGFSSAFAQAAKGPATQTVQFKTSAVCDMCKLRLEKSLAYEKGVQSATLDVPSQVLTVVYRADKTTSDALRTAIQKIGYDADTQPADARAYARLPDCCKKTNAVH